MPSRDLGRKLLGKNFKIYLLKELEKSLRIFAEDKKTINKNNRTKNKTIKIKK